MRKLALVGLLLPLLFVVSDAQAKKKSINTGDPLPKKAVKNNKCHDKGSVRLIGTDPSTPFAVVRKGAIESAGQACCAQWARKGTKWKSLDAYGQIAGDATIDGGEGYDVTQCYELSFHETNKGVGLFVDGPYKAPKSLAWTPSDGERAALAKVVATLEHTMVPTAPYACGPKKALPLAERSLYFTTKDLDGSNSLPVKWVVVGGPLMVIARLQADGRWIARDVDAFATNTCQTGAYQPRAVFDLNGDGSPELFIHQDFGDSFGDIALGLNGLGFEGRWVEVAAAVHGSTA